MNGFLISQPNHKFHIGSFAGRAAQFKCAADFFQPLFHVRQAIAARNAKAARSFTVFGGGIEAFAVVIDQQSEGGVCQRERNAHRGGGGMFEHVMQRLFECQEQIVAHLRRKRPRRELHGHVEPATNARDTQKILRELAQIGYQTVERVVLRIDRPDDFIHGPRQLAGRVVNLVQIVRRLMGIFQFGAAGLAQQRDARQAGAEVVVNVLGDARPFPFQRALPFQPLHFLAETAGG